MCVYIISVACYILPVTYVMFCCGIIGFILVGSIVDTCTDDRLRCGDGWFLIIPIPIITRGATVAIGT